LFWICRDFMVDDKKNDPFALDAGVPGIEGEMRPKPKLADRLSWRIGAVTAVILAFIVGMFMWGMSGVGEKRAAEPGKSASGEPKDALAGSKPPKDMTELAAPVGSVAGGSPDDMKGGQVAGSLIGRAMNSLSPGGGSAPVEAGTMGMRGSSSGKSGGGIPGVDWSNNGAKVPSVGAIPKVGESGVSGAILTPQQQAADQRRVAKDLAIDKEKTDRLARQAQARAGGMSAKAFDEGSSAPGGGDPSSGLKSELLKMARDSQAAAGGAAQAGQQKAADGEQDEKLAFLKAAEKAPRNYHPFVPMAPLSPNEVKEGTTISLTLEGGMNSDLPGQITARSTDDVYDSVTGCRLLLPAMTQFIGRYDSKVAIGQGRQLFVWNSAIFRDGAELNLAGMQGYDQAGQSGLASDVDNHYLRLFGLAFGMSMVTAGVQLSVPQPTQTANGAAPGMSSAQVVSTALAQQYGQLGAQILGKYMNVQPTLRNFPGERFTILVPHTIVFGKVWRNRCEAAKR
jgi:type IV secretory pathway VirB10-like protein